MERSDLLDLARAKKELEKRKARTNFLNFVTYTKDDYDVNWHHELLAQELDLFAKGETKRLAVFMPPQHGKSELTSRRLPAHLLGLDPDKKIIGCSYSSDLSTSFNRDVQRIIESKEYKELYPQTTLNQSKKQEGQTVNYRKNADIFEVVNHKGYYKSVGVGGSLTGTPADIGIIDDPVKDYIEAQSATYRERAWDWFNSVFMTRLHNDSQILITQTRWHDDDLSGRILNKLNKEGEWKIVVLEAIKDRIADKRDPRERGEALWPQRHSKKRILEIKSSSPKTFNALYQQDPKPDEDSLIFNNWLEGTFDESLPCIYGLDFGFSNDPSCLVKVAINQKHRKLYVEECFYLPGLDTDQIDILLRKFVKNRELIIADSAEPRLIYELQKRGLNIFPCVKGKDSVTGGINLMKSFEIVVTPDSTNYKRELNNYAWDATKSYPVDDWNHAIDPTRYVLAHIFLKKHARKVKKATTWQR